MRWRMPEVAWLALCIFCVTLRAGTVEHPNDDVESHAGREGSAGEAGYEYGEELPNGPVREALSLLQPLQPVHNRATSFARSSGFLSSTVYYTKEVLYLLFMNGPTFNQEQRKLSKPLSKAVTILEAAAVQQNAEAIFLLAEMNFHGNYTFPRQYSEAYRRYHQLAALNGNNTAQHQIGFMHATGLGGAVPKDQAKALMYYTFAASSGNTKAQMMTAYRHHAGIGTPRNCNEAARWYKKVADKAIAFSRSGPIGGQTLQRDAYKIADEIGGVYGEGASVVSSGRYAKRGGPNSDAHAAFDDILEYLDLMSRKGDIAATFSLGKLHYEGQRKMRRNLRTARTYFLTVARKYWHKDGSIKSEEDKDTILFASKAAGHIGRMFLRGEGTEQSPEKALTWFKRGIKNGDALCQYQMGLMHLNGVGVRKDAIKAADYFKEAANQDFASAQVNMGKLFLDQGDVNAAVYWFELAARQSHIEAFYHLAEIYNSGIGRDRSCGMATAYYKLVAERTESIHSAFDEANYAYDLGDIETALPIYMQAAEQGYEAAQANVAYLLDEHKSILSLTNLIPWAKPRSSLLRNSLLALIYWTRSAKQANIDAMVKMGDYYLNGYGIEEKNMEKAAACYQTAAETAQSAQAYWNLGWIHENGIGVEQDFHLAKRFYDQALETNQESYLPVKLALIKLRIRSWWNTVTNGKVNSIKAEPEAKQEWTFSTWLENFMAEPNPYSGMDDPDHFVDEDDYTDALTGGSNHGDRLRTSGENDDDYYDEIDDSFMESFVILGLAATLAFLVYYRNQRAMQHRRQEGQNGAGQAQGRAAIARVPGPLHPAPTGQQPDGGFFPPPGDPNHNNWRAGGVGH